MAYTRYAIYYLPKDDALAEFGAAWLGWDAVRGRPADPIAIPGREAVTARPRRYGFHATLKPPFRLVDETREGALFAAVERLARVTPQGHCGGLAVTALGGFLALTPLGDPAPLGRIAATCVRDLDAFRAPPRAEELTRRRLADLSDAEDAMLRQWGYPYVLDAFRFHMTLTERLTEDEIATWRNAVTAVMPPLPAPFVLDTISLVGEREDGAFEELNRYVLGG